MRPNHLQARPAFPSFATGQQRDEFERDLLLLSYQDITDRFGLPDDISENQSGNGTSWRYGDRRAGDPSVRIHFVDGFVTRVVASPAPTK